MATCRVLGGLLLLLLGVIEQAGALTAGGRHRHHHQHQHQHRRNQNSRLRGGVQRGPVARPWDYLNMGDAWGSMFAECNGLEQSPVDVSKAPTVVPAPEDLDEDPVKVYYKYYNKATPAEFFNDGRSLAITFQDQVGGIALGRDYPNDFDSAWALWQVAVHSPSEHRFNDTRTGEFGVVPLEVQLYHNLWVPEDADPEDIPARNTQLVLTFGFREGNLSDITSHFLDTLSAGNVPDEVDENGMVNTDAPGVMDFGSLIRHSDGISSSVLLGYDGSLTTPPCTENARWLVRPDAIPAKLHTIQNLTRALLKTIPPDGKNGRRLHEMGTRLATPYPSVDATDLPTPQEQLNEVQTVTSAPAVDARQGAGGEDATVSVVDLEDPAEEEIKNDREGCAPADTDCLLRGFDPEVLNDDEEYVMDHNNALTAARMEARKGRENATDAENKREEACQEKDRLFSITSKMPPSPEKDQKMADLAAADQQCVEAERQKETAEGSLKTMNTRVDNIRAELRRSIGQAQEHIKATTALPKDHTERHGPITPLGTVACTAAPRLHDPFTKSFGDSGVTIDKGHSNGSPFRAVGQPHVVAGPGCGVVLFAEEQKRQQKANTTKHEQVAHPEGHTSLYHRLSKKLR